MPSRTGASRCIGPTSARRGCSPPMKRRSRATSMRACSLARPKRRCFAAKAVSAPTRCARSEMASTQRGSIQHFRWMRSARGGGRPPVQWATNRGGGRLAADESKGAGPVDASLFFSEAEAALFRGQSGLGADKVRAVGNGIDTAWFDPALPLDAVGAGEGPLAVFTGQMDYRPNIDAVRWFATDILPRIGARHPSERFPIVGRAPTEEVRALEHLPDRRSGV